LRRLTRRAREEAFADAQWVYELVSAIRRLGIVLTVSGPSFKTPRRLEPELGQEAFLRQLSSLFLDVLPTSTAGDELNKGNTNHETSKFNSHSHRDCLH
jgi:hypothetical protein